MRFLDVFILRPSMAVSQYLGKTVKSCKMLGFVISCSMDHRTSYASW